MAVGEIETRHYINGSFQASSDGGTFPVRSPYGHEKIADVCEATRQDVDVAVAAAKAAFPAWAGLGPQKRGGFMKKMAALILEHASELAQLDAMSMGRPVSSYFDPFAAAAQFEHHAECAYDAMGQTSLNTPGYMNLTLRQPIGPVAAIIPWNLPTLMFGIKVAPALAAGCTVVLKSSEKAPLTPTMLAALVQRAGFPPGVINVINGHGSPSGAALSAHPDIRLINFTGSTATGRKIQTAAAASNFKKVILEMGGKSPCLIFDDADVEQAARETAASLRFLSGQSCIANSRIYVQESISTTFVAALKAHFQPKRGCPLSPHTEQGPQADEMQYNRVKEYLAKAQCFGKLQLGGEALPPENGFFIEPTIYTDVPENAPTQKEEIFGPLVNVNTFQTEEEAIAKANDSEYGLYASVYTKDISRGMRVVKAFEAGMVGLNCTSPTTAHDMPWGGWKASGQGREGFGHSLDEYLEHKAVMIKVE